MTSAEEVQPTKSPASRQQQPLQQQEVQQQEQSEPVAVGAVATSNGPGDVRAVAISSGTGSIRRVVLRQKGGLSQRGASTHPFDLGTPNYRMPSLRPKNGPNTVWGGYDEEHEEEQGDYSSSDSSSNSSSTGNSQRLDGRWDGTSSFPFDTGKAPPAFLWHVIYRVYHRFIMEYVGVEMGWTLFCFCASLCHMVIFDVVFRQVVFALCRIMRGGGNIMFF